MKLLCIQTKLLVPLNLWYAFAVVGCIDCIAVMWAIAYMVTFNLASVANVVRWQTVTPHDRPIADKKATHRHERSHKLHNGVGFLF